MAENLTICSISPEVAELLKTFRFRKSKTLDAIIMKINTSELTVVLDEEYTDTTIDELVAELPEHLPRYVALSYPLNHDDGRVSYPLLFVFICPQGGPPEQHMMYAGSKLTVVNQGGFPKVMECRSVEEFTNEAVLALLKKR